MFLAVGHLEPVQALFPAAQAAFAITFGIGFADTYTGTGDGEKIRLFHILKTFVKRGRREPKIRLRPFPFKHDKYIS